VTITNPADAAKVGIGYLSEDRKQYGLLLGRSVRDNVVLASIASFTNQFGFLRDQRVSRVANDQVAKLRIRTPSASQLVQNLSGGNQQKTVVAKWLLLRPRVLLLDEPTRGVDVGAKDEIYRLVEETAAGGAAVLFVSSEMPEVLGLADRILVMHEGRITWELS